ncbi:MAG: DHA2 family efflux MFS transporter permease subunit [Bryobacterales bacterium]|nr:DHA2 family efflux MFS transporter permease subunit [Bryobacterales bacterium]
MVQDSELQKPAINPWVIALTVTLATFMEVLDTSIANVALPHISGALAASQDESTWIITSYLVSNAIVLPISAYLATLIGRKRFYMSCVVIFGLSSLLCGLAPSLPLLLFFRVLQGAGGGGLAPSEQAILADTFPPEKRGQAFALYGLAVVIAPTLGPTLGGWITDNYDWRWIFFINLPVAVLSLFLTHRVVQDPPAVKKAAQDAGGGKFQLDYFGFALVALAFGSLEVVLDKGQEDDWFSSHFVVAFFTLFVVGLVGFVSWELWRIHEHKKPILDLRLFLNRNLSVSFVLMFMVGVLLYSTLTMLPQLLQTQMGYTAQLSGEALTAGGFAIVCCMPLVGVLVGKTDARWLVVFGFAAMAASLYYSTGLNLQMSFGYVARMRVFQTLGLAFLFIPVNTLSYVGVRPDQSNDVSGLINLARNIGGSCGTSLFATMLVRRQQVHQHYLIRNVNDSHPTYVARFSALTQQALGTAASQADAQHHALAQFYHQLQRQASVLSYIDILSLLALLALIVVPLPLLLRKPPKGAAAVAH